MGNVNDALQGSYGTPSDTNRYVTEDDPILSGGGTVTSVGLSLPSIITVSGSPVTTSGTLTGTLATQSANTVFSGPTTGAAAAPTFRALVAADIPGGIPAWSDLHWFGDGSDGALTISAGTTTPTRPMFYSAITVTGTGALQANNYPILCSGETDLSNAPADAIYRIGTGGSVGSAAGAGGNGGGLAGGVWLPVGVNGSTGGAGATGAGAQAGAVTASTNGTLGGGSGAGGAGGAGSGGAGGASRAGTNTADPIIDIRVPFGPMWQYTYRGNVNVSGIGGPGGSGGGGDGGTAGSGGGGGGGGARALTLHTKTLRRGASTTAAAIRVYGGNGGNGGTPAGGNRGGGGGGGGSGGGFALIVVGSLVGSSATNMVYADGGTGGNGGNGTGTGAGAAGGTGGDGGVIWLYQLDAGTLTVSDERGTAGTAGGAAVGTTGGTGGAGAQNRLTV